MKGPFFETSTTKTPAAFARSLKDLRFRLTCDLRYIVRPRYSFPKTDDIILLRLFYAVDIPLSGASLPRSNLRQQHRGLVGKSDLFVVTADAFMQDAFSRNVCISGSVKWQQFMTGLDVNIKKIAGTRIKYLNNASQGTLAD